MSLFSNRKKKLPRYSKAEGERLADKLGLPKSAPKVRIAIYKSYHGWLWCIKTTNGHLLAQSDEPVDRRRTAVDTAMNMINNIRNYPVEILGDNNAEGPTRV